MRTFGSFLCIALAVAPTAASRECGEKYLEKLYEKMPANFAGKRRFGWIDRQFSRKLCFAVVGSGYRS